MRPEGFPPGKMIVDAISETAPICFNEAGRFPSRERRRLGMGLASRIEGFQ